MESSIVGEMMLLFAFILLMTVSAAVKTRAAASVPPAVFFPRNTAARASQPRPALTFGTKEDSRKVHRIPAHAEHKPAKPHAPIRYAAGFTPRAERTEALLPVTRVRNPQRVYFSDRNTAAMTSVEMRRAGVPAKRTEAAEKANGGIPAVRGTVACESTPFVLNQASEQMEMKPPDSRLTPSPVMNGFAFVFSVNIAARMMNAAEIRAASEHPRATEPVFAVQANARKDERLMMPSVNMAMTPVYSLISAPVEANSRGRLFMSMRSVSCINASPVFFHGGGKWQTES